MKKLLNTLFVTSEDAFLTLKGETICIAIGNDVAGRFPLHTIESIICFSYAGATPALMGECADRGINIAFFTQNGRFLCRACGKNRGNVLLRKKQYKISEDKEVSCQIARNFILGKVYNARWSINRSIRDHELRIDSAKCRNAEEKLVSSLDKIRCQTDLEGLRGLEGECASVYFSVFDELILNQKEDFFFNGRNKRPPLDNVNAMLSFGYSLLANDCASALEGVGLDSYVGFMHQDRPGRMSLALDLMEELRAIIVDRFVLTLINNKQIKRNMFDNSESGAVRFTDEGRKKYLALWQERKKEVIRHPYLGENIQWGLVPHVQALLLARFLREDLDAYPPFLWK